MAYRRMSVQDLELLFGIEIPNLDGCFGKNKDGITEKQRCFIHNLGINITGIKYKGQASIIIQAVIHRKECGLATIKQLQTIRNLGVKTKTPFQYITQVEASKIISRYI